MKRLAAMILVALVGACAASAREHAPLLKARQVLRDCEVLYRRGTVTMFYFGFLRWSRGQYQYDTSCFHAAVNGAFKSVRTTVSEAEALCKSSSPGDPKLLDDFAQIKLWQDGGDFPRIERVVEAVVSPKERYGPGAPLTMLSSDERRAALLRSRMPRWLSAAPLVQWRDRLERQRRALFDKTSERRGSAYDRGDIGSEHCAIFPVGSAKTVFYMSYCIPYQPGDGEEGLRMARWDMTGTGPKRIWIGYFEPRNARRLSGTLMDLAFGLGDPAVPGETLNYVPMRIIGDRRQAGLDLAIRRGLVSYEYNEHGDVSLGNVVAVFDNTGDRLAYWGIPIDHSMPRENGSYTTSQPGTMLVISTELRLMAFDHKRKPRRGRNP